MASTLDDCEMGKYHKRQPDTNPKFDDIDYVIVDAGLTDLRTVRKFLNRLAKWYPELVQEGMLVTDSKKDSEEKPENPPPAPIPQKKTDRNLDLTGVFEVKVPMDKELDQAIFHLLEGRGATWKVNNGIVYVTDADGSTWDFTVPTKKKVK